MSSVYTESDAVVMERPGEVRFRKVRLSPAQPGAAVAETRLSAISSGTDMKTYFGLQPAQSLYYPCVPGYENMGKIVALDGDSPFAVGDRVMINECRRFGDVCGAWGGSVRYSIKDKVTAPSVFDYMVKVPDNVSDRNAVLAYLACVVQKGLKRVPLHPGDTVVVVGAGMIGISALEILKLLEPGVTTVCVERNAFRRAIAAHYADHVFSVEEAEKRLAELTGGKLADAVVECSGNPEAVGHLHRYLKEGGWGLDDPAGHIHLQGDYPGRIVMDAYNFWFNKNCTITMSCALGPGCKEQVLAWMSAGKFDTTHLPIEVWPVEKCAEAYKYKAEAGDDVFKILLDWEA